MQKKSQDNKVCSSEREREEKRGRANRSESQHVSGFMRDHRSRQARNYIFIIFSSPGCLLRRLIALKVSDTQSRAAAIITSVEGLVTNTDPPKNPEEGVQNSFKWQGKDGGRGSDYFCGVSSRSERAGGVSVQSLNTCLLRGEGREAEGWSTGEKWITSRVP